MLAYELPLPRAEMKTKDGRATAMRVPEVESGTRILIVDHDRTVGLALSFMLAARRYDAVRAVRSAERAIAIAPRFRPDIVFLDLDLPDIGSVTMALRLARDAHQNQPRLIALTKNPKLPMREEARFAGFERLLVKPVSHEELDRILDLGHTAT